MIPNKRYYTIQEILSNNNIQSESLENFDLLNFYIDALISKFLFIESCKELKEKYRISNNKRYQWLALTEQKAKENMRNLINEVF